MTIYVLDEHGDFEGKFNSDLAGLADMDDGDVEFLRDSVERHVSYTGSKRGTRILEQWDEYISKFVKVLPRDFARATVAIKKARSAGLGDDEAMMAAFQENIQNASRVSGN